MHREILHTAEKSVTVQLVNSFTRNGNGGNPAGVVLAPPNLSALQKTTIAKMVGYSETAFVYPSEEADFNVEFFTAEGEVDFCGHATLAVFFTLHEHGKIKEGEYTQKTKAGILSVAVGQQGVVMDQALPTIKNGPSVSAAAAALGVSNEVIADTGLPIKVISTGLPDIIVPVRNGALDAMNPDFSAIAALSREFGTIGCHVFELDNQLEPTANCRNFAPLYGINEESATGSSSGALGCYLFNYVPSDQTHFTFEQGRAMGELSLIQVVIDGQENEVHRVRVGGQAMSIGTKMINL